MDVTHSIEIVAKVDGVQVHSGGMSIEASGPVGDLMRGFDPVLAVVMALRLEANHLEEAVRRGQRKPQRTDIQVIDAHPPGEILGS